MTTRKFGFGSIRVARNLIDIARVDIRKYEMRIAATQALYDVCKELIKSGTLMGINARTVLLLMAYLKGRYYDDVERKQSATSRKFLNAITFKILHDIKSIFPNKDSLKNVAFEHIKLDGAGGFADWVASCGNNVVSVPPGTKKARKKAYAERRAARVKKDMEMTHTASDFKA